MSKGSVLSIGSVLSARLISLSTVYFRPRNERPLKLCFPCPASSHNILSNLFSYFLACLNINVWFLSLNNICLSKVLWVLVYLECIHNMKADCISWIFIYAVWNWTGPNLKTNWKSRFCSNPDLGKRVRSEKSLQLLIIHVQWEVHIRFHTLCVYIHIYYIMQCTKDVLLATPTEQ